MSTGQLVVPKHAVDAELRDVRGRIRSVQFFLSGTEPEAPKERLQDLLQARRFIPVRTPSASESGDPTGDLIAKFELLSREHVMWVRVDLMTAIDELDDETEDADESVTAAVTIELDDGTILEGELRYLLPSGSQRLGDYLEGLPAYFQVRTPDHLYLVRRDHVVTVIPSGEGTR